MSRICVQLTSASNAFIEKIQQKQVVAAPKAGICAVALEAGLEQLAQKGGPGNERAETESTDSRQAASTRSATNSKFRAKGMLQELLDKKTFLLLQKIQFRDNIAWDDIIRAGAQTWLQNQRGGIQTRKKKPR